MACLLLSQLPLSSAPAKKMMPESLFEQEITAAAPRLFIILSPQYAHDPDIAVALYRYTTAVYHDLQWTSMVRTLAPEENKYRIIDAIIEQQNNISKLKACLMVGEDLDTALACDSGYMEQPSITPWATTGGPSVYETTDDGIMCQSYTINICISLLYPTHALPYETKKIEIISALTKFTVQREVPITNGIRIFENANLSASSHTMYQHLSCLAPCSYQADPTAADVQQSLTEPCCALYMVHGHSTPSGTDLNTQPHTVWFSADNLDRLRTTMFCADGCYTGGWWSDAYDNNRLDPSIDSSWYGGKIFTSTTLHVMALGLLSQNGLSMPVSFLENVLPQLLSGKTLAESMVGSCTIGDTIIVGDPTFHFIV
ncbi:MAG TPA: hypothetical protein VMT57_08600 [Candidatus Thermoplasmatota archaeon]|nr:hypothetical protein [Candidatus Thermoplasmatota archaeon]